MLFRSDGQDIATGVVAVRAHQTRPPPRFRAGVVRKLKGPVSQWENFTVNHSSHVDDQHPFGMTLTGAAIVPFTKANDTVTGRSDRLRLHTTNDPHRMPHVAAFDVRVYSSQHQAPHHGRDVESASSQVEHFIVTHIERELPERTLIGLIEGGGEVRSGPQGA